MDSLEKDNQLLANIKSQLAELVTLLNEMNSHWCYEDPIYRFYYHSFKVYNLQNETKKIVEALKSTAPAGTTFCREFEEIIQLGAGGKKFESVYLIYVEGMRKIFCIFHLTFGMQFYILVSIIDGYYPD